MFIEHAGFEFEVDVTHFYAGLPAKLSGGPEDCYPAEDADIEYEIVSVNIPPESHACVGDINEEEFERQVLEAHIDEITDIY